VYHLIFFQIFQEEGIPATFFLVSDYFTYGDVAFKEDITVRALLEGHNIGDHSYDHMSHNQQNGGGVYGPDLDKDLAEFGIKNLAPLLDIMSRFN